MIKAIEINGKVKHNIPTFINFKNNVSEILKDIKKANIQTIGTFESNTFQYPISRVQSLRAIKIFL